MRASRLTAIDLFAGAGGATQGLKDAGFEVLGAVEIDQTASASFHLNHPEVKMWTEDITRIPAQRMLRELGLKPGELSLLKACPPCQGFSTLAEGRIEGDDPRNDLVLQVGRFVSALKPQSLMLENVPGLGRDPRSALLVGRLTKLGYKTRSYVVNAKDFNVPQNRKRFILLAVRGRGVELPEALSNHEVETPKTVAQAFAELAAEAVPGDSLNEPRVLSGPMLDRVRAIPPEGTRYDLPEHLQLECHKRMARADKRGASGSYGRLKWNSPAPTMTTRCTSPSCGSFLHPVENRPITLREAAVIQTFPPTYQFSGSRAEVERQIGNAVPIAMARGIASQVAGLLGS